MRQQAKNRTESSQTALAPQVDNGHGDEASPSEDRMAKGTSTTGLSQAEVQRRLEQYGYNELTEEEVNPFLKFLSYLWGPIPWMIEVAAILSALVRHWTDLIIILVLLVVNAVVGFWEEYQSGNTIAALKAKLALQARVKRDNKWAIIPARELVPGDLIRLRLGDIIQTVGRRPRGSRPVGPDWRVAAGDPPIR